MPKMMKIYGLNTTFHESIKLTGRLDLSGCVATRTLAKNVEATQLSGLLFPSNNPNICYENLIR